MQRIVIYILLFFLTATGCKKEKPSQPASDSILVRIENTSSWTFYDCTVDPTGTLSNSPGVNAYNYGNIDINGTSNYHSFPLAYRYSWVRLTMNNNIYYLKPFDYTGESPLTNGNYTYKITYSSIGDHLGLELVKD